MPAFEYRALAPDGRQRKGVIESDSSRQARQQLRDRGLAPTAVRVVSAAQENGGGGRRRFAFGQSIGPLQLALLTRQLATLVAAGLPVEESLHTIARQTEGRRLSTLIANVRGRVLEGHSLAAALGEYPQVFTAMYRSTVAAGEQSGYLHAVLENLANHTEERFESVRNVQMALFYPVMLFAVSALIIAGLMVYVVPQIVDVFTDTGQTLPFLTVALIATSDFLVDYGWLLAIGVAVLVLAVRGLLKRRDLRLAWDRHRLTLPVAGKIARGASASRYAATLAILTKSGVPLVDAMRIATETAVNSWLEQRLAEAVQSVSEGTTLHVALEAAGVFPPMFLHMIASGEASGELDAMLDKVATYQQQELTRTVTTLVQLLQPLMLLLMAAVVLTIVLAILVPILGMNQLVA